MRWEQEIKNYVGVVQTLRVGDVAVGNAQYNHRPGSPDGSHIAYCRLPDGQYELGEFDSMELAKGGLEKAVKAWFKRAGFPLQGAN